MYRGRGKDEGKGGKKQNKKNPPKPRKEMCTRILSDGEKAFS